jgi:two-component system, OmpR family, sensor histidine kinase KdpD
LLPVTRNAIHLLLRVLAALGLITAITSFFVHFPSVNATTTGFFYLVGILVIATFGGLIESTIASVVAMLCFNYFFFPPTGTFTVADPQNWVALFAFLATSLTASQLSARAKHRTRETIERQTEIERLYSLSRSLLLADPARPVARQVVQQIAQVFELSEVALYDRNSDEVYRAGMGDVSDIEARMKEAALQSTVIREGNGRLIVAPVRLGGHPIGSLAVRGVALPDAALQSLLNLVAIAMERALSQAAVNRAEVARQNEELKSILLDAIAHEFKTPLTSIKAVTTDLLSEPAGVLPEHQRELINIADEGADRLSKLVTDAIQLTRIEGGTFRLNRGVYFPSSLVAAALRQMKTLTDGRGFQVSLPDDLPPVFVDSELIQMVAAHLIENALKYSPAGTPISIGARAAPTEEKVVIYIKDRGPGISEEEQSRIFEKFYRGANERNLKGTGMGLAIAREIVRAHGGEIWVTSKAGEGSEFCFSLPLAPKENNQ